MESVAYDLDIVPVDLTEKGRSEQTVQRQEESDWVALDVLANVDSFRRTKRHQYGDNYEKFVGLYEMVADTLRPTQFEMLIKKVYEQYHRDELFELVGNPYTTDDEFKKFQDGLFDELKKTAANMRSVLRQERYHKTVSAASHLLH